MEQWPLLDTCHIIRLWVHPTAGSDRQRSDGCLTILPRELLS